MIDLYYWPTPNGWKVTILLEELGLPYQIFPVDIGAGDQFKPDFLKFSPNNKMPAIIDHDGPGGGDFSLFESGAILWYLAEKTGQFNPTEPRERATVMSWVMFQMGGVGPMLGQYHHFARYAADKNQHYAMERYANERYRLYCVMDKRLGTVPYLAGDAYSLADIATWPWIMPKHQDIDLAEFPNVARWHETVKARPAVQRGRAVGEELRSLTTMTDEQKEVLFGKTQFQRR